MGGPFTPVGFASDTWKAVDPGVFIDFEVGTTHGTFTVDPGHCLHLVHWMLKALRIELLKKSQN